MGNSMGTMASRMSFDTCERRSFTHSVPLPSSGIVGAVLSEILYFIVNHLIVCDVRGGFVTVTVVTVIFRGCDNSLFYIYIYLYIN